METSRGHRFNLTAVISPDYCIPEHVRLTIIVKKLFAVRDGNLVVTDEKGNIMFKVMEKMLSIHDRHILLNAGGIPIVNFKKKCLSAHERWQVFRGESSDSAGLLFSARKSSVLQLKTELEVFLSGNKEEISWDFKVVGSCLERSYLIYAKDSTLIAKMHKKHTFGSIVPWKETFDATVNPQVDHAFIVALVVIIYEIDD